MNEDLKKKLEATIASCAKKAEETKISLEAMQFTQAAVNASNIIHCLESISRMEK